MKKRHRVNGQRNREKMVVEKKIEKEDETTKEKLTKT